MYGVFRYGWIVTILGYMYLFYADNFCESKVEKWTKRVRCRIMSHKHTVRPLLHRRLMFSVGGWLDRRGKLKRNQKLTDIEPYC